MNFFVFNFQSLCGKSQNENRHFTNNQIWSHLVFQKKS